jgi:hypothetical protein
MARLMLGRYMGRDRVLMFWRIGVVAKIVRYHPKILWRNNPQSNGTC